MVLLFFLFLSSNSQEELQPIAAMVNQEGILYVTKEGFKQYDFAGNKLSQIPGTPNDAILQIGDFFLVKDSTRYQSRFFSVKGKVDQVIENTGWRYLIKLTDDLIAVVPDFFQFGHLEYLNNKLQIELTPDKYLKIYDPGTDPNPLMIQLIHVEVKDGQFQLIQGKSFFRATKEQKRLRLNFKKMFIEKAGSFFYVMTELNDEIYYYDDSTINEERSIDPRMPFKKPSLSLELKKFVSTEKSHAFPKGIYTDMDELYKDQYCWLFNRSKILHFSKEETGFTVVYSVPSKQDDLPCDTVDVYIQELAIDGSNIGEPFVIEKQSGSFAGLVKDKLYWFNKEMNAKTGHLEVINIR